MPPLLFPLLLLSFATTLALTTASTIPPSFALAPAKRSSDSLMHCSNDLPALCKGGTRVAVNVLCMCDNQKPPCDGWQCPAFWTLRQVCGSQESGCVYLWLTASPPKDGRAVDGLGWN